jgi:hypothetical protein
MKGETEGEEEEEELQTEVGRTAGSGVIGVMMRTVNV